MAQVLMQVRSRTGHDFSRYKKSTVARRVERRMSQHGIDDLRAYARYLADHPLEVSLLFKELLINVTSFFRDPEAFELLRRQVLLQILADKPKGYVIRAWVPACATGEEAYSIAILLREILEETDRDYRVQIYATDLDDDAIGVARAGFYPTNIVQDVSPERLRRFFVKDEAGYRLKKEIREMVVFAVQNAVKDPPFTRLDLVSCRNLLIYLEPELQDRLISTLHYALRPGGVLLLSPSESLGHHSDLFAPLDRQWKLYRVIPSIGTPRALAGERHPWRRTTVADAPREPARRGKEGQLADLARQALVQAFAPASVLTDLAGNILYVHGKTGKFLSPAAGRASFNVISMAHEGLQVELRDLFHEPVRLKGRVVRREVLMKVDGKVETVILGVQPLPAPDGDEAPLLVSFQEVVRAEPPGRGRGQPTGRPDARRVTGLERALAQSEELLRTSVKEQQASTEEFKSINEELQSTNEELQSTNEELETSKEELQSVNEELLTVNGELQAKVDQLARVQNDLRNLFDSNGVGTVFLDEHLAIRRYTREATRIFRIVATDVGRPLGDIKTDLPGEEILAGARRVLDTLVPWERELTGAGGVSYLARIQPYRTLDNVIQGVVMTFTDISLRVTAEAALEEARELAQSIVDTVREPVVVLDESMKVVSASRAFYEEFQVTPEETAGRVIFELGNHQWDVPALRQLLETVIQRDGKFDGYVVEHDFPRVGRRRLLLNARRLARKTGETRRILLAMESDETAPSG